MGGTDILILVVVYWLWTAAIGAYISQQKNRGALEGFILGLFLGVLGIIIAIWQTTELPKAQPGRRAVKCPVCNAVRNIEQAAPRYECWQCKTKVGVQVPAHLQKAESRPPGT